MSVVGATSASTRPLPMAPWSGAGAEWAGGSVVPIAIARLPRVSRE